MPDMLKTFTAGNFWLGLGTAFAVSVLGPTIGKTAKPLAVKGVHGMLYLSDKTGEMLKTGMKQMDTMMGAGVAGISSKMPSGEDMKHLVEELKEQNRNATQEITKLYHEIGDIKNQLEQLKPM